MWRVIRFLFRSTGYQLVSFDHLSCLRKCQDVIEEGESGVVESVGFFCGVLSLPVDVRVPVGH